MSRNQFQPGNRSGGRPVGARNKLQRDLLEALAADFQEYGAGVIRIARIEKPVEYLKICIGSPARASARAECLERHVGRGHRCESFAPAENPIEQTRAGKSRPQMRKKQSTEFAGQRWGQWTLLKPLTIGGRLWLCRCSCGTTRTVEVRALWRGRSRSCGSRGCSTRSKSVSEFYIRGRITIAIEMRSP
jgi:hypothetical protein